MEKLEETKDRVILDKMKKKMNKMVSEYQKFWQEIELPISLADGLTRYTKEELSHIRKRLNLKNASSLNKADLIHLLEISIPFYVKNLILNMDQNQFSLLKTMVRQKGVMTDPNLDLDKLKILQSLGFIFFGTHKGKKTLVLPKELIDPLTLIVNDAKVIAIIKRNTQWILLTQGMLYYYGVMSMQMLFEKLEQYMKEPVNKFECLKVLHLAQEYYLEFDWHRDGLTHYRVRDSETIINEQTMRRSVDYYPFTKDQLLTAGKPDFAEWNESSRAFLTYLLQTYEITKDEAREIIQDCVYTVQEGENPQELFHILQSRLEFDDLDSLQTCMNFITNLANNTRQWFLKGYSSTELFEKEKKFLNPLPTSPKMTQDSIPSTVKVGRNDPCPCGSGKKYKKCCGIV